MRHAVDKELTGVEAPAPRREEARGRSVRDRIPQRLPPRAVGARFLRTPDGWVLDELGRVGGRDAALTREDPHVRVLHLPRARRSSHRRGGETELPRATLAAVDVRAKQACPRAFNRASCMHLHHWPADALARVVRGDDAPRARATEQVASARTIRWVCTARAPARERRVVVHVCW